MPPAGHAPGVIPSFDFALDVAYHHPAPEKPMPTPSESPARAPKRRPVPRDQNTPIQVAIDCCLFLVLFVTPWLISTQLKEVFNTTKNCFVGFVAVAAMVAFLVDGIMRKEFRIPKGKVVVLATLLVLWSAVSITWSIFWRLSLVEYSYQLAMYTIFLVTYCNVYDRERLENLLHFSIAAGVVTSGYALIQYYSWDVPVFTRLTNFFNLLLPSGLAQYFDFRFLILPPKPDEATKIYSTMGHRNYLAGYMIAVIPIALSRLYAAIDRLQQGPGEASETPDSARERARASAHFGQSVRAIVVYAVSLVLMVVTVILTHTRGSWVGLAIALAVFFFIMWRKFPVVLGKRRTLAVVGALACILMLLGPTKFKLGSLELHNPFNREPRSVLQRLSASVQTLANTSAHQRLLIYRTALFIIFDSPQHFLFGTGIGSFGLQYMPYQRLVLRSDPPHSAIQQAIDKIFADVFFKGKDNTEHWILEINKSIYAHNEILHFWSEIGLVGILLMLTLLYYLFKDAYQLLKRAAADSEMLLFTGMICSICAVLGHNLFTFDLHLSYTSVLFWFLIAACQRFTPREEWSLRWGQRHTETLDCAGARFAMSIEETPQGAVQATCEVLQAPDDFSAPEWQMQLREPSGPVQSRLLSKAGPVSLRRPLETGDWTLRLKGPSEKSPETATYMQPRNPLAQPLLIGSVFIAAFLICKAIFAQVVLENAWRDGFLKFRQHQFEDSFLDFKRALRMDPNRGEVLFDFGRGLMDSNRNKVGIQTFEQATYSFVDPANYHNVALCYYKENDLVNAERAYRKALDLNIIYEQSLANLAFLLMDKASRKQAEGDKASAEALNQEADELLKRGMKYYPRNNQFASTLGAIRAQQGKLEEAAEMFEKGLKADPNQCKVWINYGTVLYNLKRYDKAIEAMRKARKTCKGAENEELLKGKFVNILKGYYHGLLEKSPTDKTVITSYARDLMDAGLHSEAQDILRKLLASVAPGDPWASYYLAECYLKLGYRARARTELERLKSTLAPGGDLAALIDKDLAQLAVEASDVSPLNLTTGSASLLPLSLPLTPR
jgi:tetratricopeptide (TPR) repeat protein/O-antigen ligase